MVRPKGLGELCEYWRFKYKRTCANCNGTTIAPTMPSHFKGGLGLSGMHCELCDNGAQFIFEIITASETRALSFCWGMGDDNWSAYAESCPMSKTYTTGI